MDDNLLLDIFIAASKTKKETMKEFTQKFDNLLREIPDRFKPYDYAILDRYIRSLHGNFTYAIRDKKKNNLEEANKISTEAERNLNASRIDLFDYPRVMIDSKKKYSYQVDPFMKSFAKFFHKLTNDIIQGQNNNEYDVHNREGEGISK